MFTRKYTISLLDTNWQVIKRNLKMTVIPRKDEYIWFSSKYYLITNIVHTLNPNEEVILVVEEQSMETSKIIL
jgi:hypothetical protein